MAFREEVCAAAGRRTLSSDDTTTVNDARTLFIDFSAAAAGADETSVDKKRGRVIARIQPEKVRFSIRQGKVEAIERISATVGSDPFFFYFFFYSEIFILILKFIYTYLDYI